MSSIPLGGSHRRHPDNSIHVGHPNPNATVQATVVLRQSSSTAVEAVETFASDHQLSVMKAEPAARTITVQGTAAAMSSAFAVDFELRQIGESVFRTRVGPVNIPESLAGSVIAVLGLDERPAAHSYHSVQPHRTGAVSYTPRQLAQIYNFPSNTGKNQTIALIELDGGYRNTDLKKYWRKLGLSNVSVTAVSVDGARNAPTGDPNGPDGEVVLDIEVAGGIAPGAQIAVYFAPNTDEGFLNAINAAIHDKIRKPSVISISWGAAENQWTPQAINAFNQAFRDAANLGISVCVASGDNGSSDGVDDGLAHVDFPASSPWVLACGGTSLLASNGKIQLETVWNDGTNFSATGGGLSTYFPKPDYQTGYVTSTTNGRGVPDVSAVADAATGYQVLIDGVEMVVGGTSAVAPLWAGLIALMNEQLGKNLGWFHPALYGTVAHHQALNDVVSGTNGDFRAGKSWDACTGLGSPNGQAILNVLKQNLGR